MKNRLYKYMYIYLQLNCSEIFLEEKGSNLTDMRLFQYPRFHVKNCGEVWRSVEYCGVL